MAYRSSNPEAQLRAIWRGMIRRTSNPAHKSNHLYGGRGLTVLPSWLNSFAPFAADVGPRPRPECQPERIQNDNGYWPENVKWTSSRNNARNRRTNRFVEVNGVDLPLDEDAELAGIKYASTLRYLLKWGWPAGVMAAASHGEARVEGHLVVGVLHDEGKGDDRQRTADLDLALFTGLGKVRNVINVLSADVVPAFRSYR